MRIHEIFETRIEEKIEPVIKVGERQDEIKLAAEIGSYVVTPTIERYIDDFLEHYTDTIYNETTEIGAWISGYFGSGKSHLAKTLALVSENRVLNGILAGKRLAGRIPSDAPRHDSILRSLGRLSKCDTQIMAFNLNTLADSKNTALPRILLSQYYLSCGYGGNLIYARVIEAEIDKRGRLDDLHAAASRLSGKPWEDMQKNLSFYARALNQAACEVAPEVFSSPEEVAQALKNAEKGELYNVQFLVNTILTDLSEREKQLGKPCRMLLVLDESGQWIEADGGRLGQLQALVEEAAAVGKGKIWLFATTHADMASIYSEARVLKSEMKKIEPRFRHKWNLTAENIELVLEDRLFKKKLAGKNEVIEIYNSNPGVLRDLGQLSNTTQKLPECSLNRFATFYPFFPYQIHLIPDIVKSLRSAGGHGEQLSGSTRTLLAITQDIIRAGRRDYLNAAIGEIVSFDEVYHNLSGEGEVNPDIRRELSKIETAVEGANELTRRVGEVLYLIGQVSYVPRTIDNLARLLVQYSDEDLTTIINKIDPELERLYAARMVAKIGDEYEFLTGERRSFEDEVKDEYPFRWQDMEAGLSVLAQNNNLLGFETIPFKGKDFPVRTIFDGTVIKKDGYIDVYIHSPLSNIAISTLEDQSLRPDEQRSIFILGDRISDFEDKLKYYLAMKTVIDRWKGDSGNQEKSRFAIDRENKELSILKDSIKTSIQTSLKRARIVFRGSSRALPSHVDLTTGEILRQEISKYWPTLYSKFEKVPVRILNEQKAITDVLNGKDNGAEVKELRLFDNAGQLDPRSPIIDAIRLYLTLRQNAKQRIMGKDLLAEFAGPPYGWDPGAVRVGVAAMVRSGTVRLQMNKKPYNNPADPELQEAMRVSRSFDKIELILEETEVDPLILTTVRALLIKISGRRKIDETPAALADEMESLGRKLLGKASRTALWAEPAGFPLPSAFNEGREALARILALNNPVHRINEINACSEHLESYTAAINAVSDFIDKKGKLFTAMRNFITGLLSIEHRLPSSGACMVLLENWGTALDNVTIIEPEIWKGLQDGQASADLELTALLKAWREEAKKYIQSALSRLPKTLVEIGGAESKFWETLAKPFEDFQVHIDQENSIARVASLPEQAILMVRKMDEAILEEINRRNPVIESDPPDSIKSKPIQRIRVSEVTTLTRIETEAQWEQIRNRLDEKVKNMLAAGNAVELE